jgi:hypothetical protein
VVLGEQIVLVQLQGVLMPLDGFWTAVVAPPVLQIVLKRRKNEEGNMVLALPKLYHVGIVVADMEEAAADFQRR